MKAGKATGTKSVGKAPANEDATPVAGSSDAEHAAENVGSWQIWSYQKGERPWKEGGNVKQWGSSVEARSVTLATFQAHFAQVPKQLGQCLQATSFKKVAEALNKLHPGVHPSNLLDMLETQQRSL